MYKYVQVSDTRNLGYSPRSCLTTPVKPDIHTSMEEGAWVYIGGKYVVSPGGGYAWTGDGAGKIPPGEYDPTIHAQVREEKRLKGGRMDTPDGSLVYRGPRTHRLYSRRGANRTARTDVEYTGSVDYGGGEVF